MEEKKPTKQEILDRVAAIEKKAADIAAERARKVAERERLEKEETKDGLYDDAVKITMENGKASTSVLQRRLRIGYGRAALLMDEMERRGIIGPPDGTMPRMVLNPASRSEENAEIPPAKEVKETLQSDVDRPAEDTGHEKSVITEEVTVFNRESLVGKYGEAAVQKKVEEQRAEKLNLARGEAGEVTGEEKSVVPSFVDEERARIARWVETAVSEGEKNGLQKELDDLNANPVQYLKAKKKTLEGWLGSDKARLEQIKSEMETLASQLEKGEQATTSMIDRRKTELGGYISEDKSENRKLHYQGLLNELNSDPMGFLENRKNNFEANIADEEEKLLRIKKELNALGVSITDEVDEEKPAKRDYNKLLGTPGGKGIDEGNKPSVAASPARSKSDMGPGKVDGPGMRVNLMGNSNLDKGVRLAEFRKKVEANQKIIEDAKKELGEIKQRIAVAKAGEKKEGEGQSESMAISTVTGEAESVKVEISRLSGLKQELEKINEELKKTPKRWYWFNTKRNQLEEERGKHEEEIEKEEEKEATKIDKAKNPFKWFLINSMSDDNFARIFDLDSRQGKENVKKEVNKFIGENGELKFHTDYNNMSMYQKWCNIVAFSSNGFYLMLENEKEITGTSMVDIRNRDIKNPKAKYTLVGPNGDRYIIGMDYVRAMNNLKNHATTYQEEKELEFSLKK